MWNTNINSFHKLDEKNDLKNKQTNTTPLPNPDAQVQSQNLIMGST